jgi:hypothetical protein
MDVNKVVENMIEESYPLLQGKKVHTYSFGFGTLRGLAARLLPNYRFILYHPEEKNSSEASFIGFLAHELVHLEDNEREGYLNKLKSRVRYFTDMEMFEKGERATDQAAIEKAYAKQLYAQALTLPDRLGSNAKYYLSAEQVKTYAIKVGTWK